MNCLDKPNIHLFVACGKHYIYDVCNNIILRVTSDCYRHINNMMQSDKISISEFRENQLVNQLMDEGFLKFQTVDTLVHPLSDKAEDLLNNDLHMLILQVTQNCNLRCKYCIYSGSYINRQHNNKRMDFNTAQKAIDFYILHSSQMNKLRFGFYGGEPILELNLIKQCVDYINKKAFGREIEYNLTTNATMLNKDIMEFLVRNNFYLTISLDGPENIQNKNRVFAGSDKGTFDSVMHSVMDITENYPDYMANVHFNMVMNPEDGYKESNDFFVQDRRVNGYYVTATEQNDVNYKQNINKSEEYYINRAYEQFKMIYSYFRGVNNGASPLVEGYLTNIKKNIADQLKKDVSGFLTGHPGGPCMPGLQRLFADADGNFFPCERVNETSEIMRIGDVDSGINVSKVKKLLNVGKITEDSCKKCWAFRFCTSCAVYAEDGDKLSAQKRLSRCSSIKNSVEANLREYCVLKELGFDFVELENDEVLE